MNYVHPSNMTFTAKKDIRAGRKPSEQSKAIEGFINSHNFSVSIDKNSGEPVLKVSKKNELKFLL